MTNQPIDRDSYLQFFIDVPITLGGCLQSKLPMSEDDFRHVAAISWEDGRSYYLYGLADEVIKAGLAISRWGEFLSGPDEPIPDDPKERHIDRLCLEWTLDEQQLWQRKLCEWLTNLVCFSNTNSQEYYRLFLAAQAYDCEIADWHDLVTYYGCDCHRPGYTAPVRVG